MMSAVSETAPVKKRSLLRSILLLLAILSLPFGCCGCTFLLDVLPTSLLPSQLDFMVNLFEAEARVENRTGETLYLTPITTTYGYPAVIPQTASIRQRDIPLQPGSSLVLTYDSADLPLAGIAVCRSDSDCRLLSASGGDTHSVDSFESLPELEPRWLQAVQSHSRDSFGVVVMPALGLLPIVLFAGWLYLTRSEKKRVD